MDVPGKRLQEKVIHLWTLRLTALSLACSVKYAAALCPAGEGCNTIRFGGDTGQGKQTQHSPATNLTFHFKWNTFEFPATLLLLFTHLKTILN